MKEDPKIIYLQPDDETVDQDLGRMWCEDQGMFESDNPGTKYVRADLVKDRLELLTIIDKDQMRIAELKDALPDPEKLRILADWFDHNHYGDNEVQRDLRKWAAHIDIVKDKTILAKNGGA